MQQHVLGRAAGAGHGRELLVAELAAHRERLGRRRQRVLRERAVEVRAEPDRLERAEPARAHAGSHQHALSQHGLVDTRPGRLDQAAAVRALDEGEWRRRAPPAAPVPARARVDVRRVDAGGEDPDEHLALTGQRPSDLAHSELLEAAVSRGDDGEHGRPTGRGVEALGAAPQLLLDDLVHRRHSRASPRRRPRFARPSRAARAFPRSARRPRSSRAARSTDPARPGTPRPRSPCRRPCRRGEAR